MCGRQACTLAPEQVSNTCQYRDRNGIIRQPQWVSLNPSREGRYNPSPNIGPKSTTPILMSRKRVANDKVPKEKEDQNPEERVLCEMQWGLVPSWHKGNFDDFKFNMINCRSDTILEKASFRGPLERGQRCVAVAEGFFEWKNEKDGRKQPYLIHFKEENAEGKVSFDENKLEVKKVVKSKDDAEICSEDVKCETDHSKTGVKSEVEEKKQCKRPVYMAALYDLWKAPGSIEPLYTYTIITVDSSNSLNWLHERMPAILETDEQVHKWLDIGEVPKNEALKLLKPVNSLSWYPVSTVVNNVRNKSPDCMKEIDLSVKKVSKYGSSNLMGFWLKKSPKKPEKETDSGIPLKKTKTD